MNFKTTVVLLVLLIAVGVYFGVQHFVGPRGPQTAVSTNNKLITASTDQIDKVVITHSDGTKTALSKSGGTWELTAPISAPADKFAVDDLLGQITGLASRGQLPADRKSSVGLDHPRTTVDVTANGKTTKLAFGDENKVGDSLYVLVDEQSTPRIVGTAIYDQLDKQPDTYRSKKLAPLTSAQTDQVKQLTITSGGQTVRLEKQRTNWQITKPSKMPADGSAVGNVLFAISDLNANDFVQTPAAGENYGLTPPTTKVWYSTSGPTTRPTTQPAGTTIEFGRYVSLDHKDVYARANNGPVAMVPATSLDSFRKTALDLRDKKVVDIDPASVESFTLAANLPPTTHPTTRPAQLHEFTIVRRQETPTPIGPAAPAILPATQPAASATRPAGKSALASTRPTSKPALATTRPAVPAPTSKWAIESGGHGDANDAQVEAILSALHPLQADKFLAAYATTRPAGTYTLTLHTGPAGGHGPQTYVLHLISPGATGAAIGDYNDLTFQTGRTILDKLDVNFKGGK